MIIDSHSHFGVDYYKGIIKISDYINYSNSIGINIGLLMPCAAPVNNNEKILKTWYKNNAFFYRPNCNPFIEMNYQYFEKINKYNCDKVRLIYIPYIHPVLDETNKIEKLINDINPPFLKINGVQSCVDISKIPKEFIKLLKKYDLPIIVHTQFQNEYNDSFEGNNIIKKLNHPYEWAQFIINNNIKGILNHGCGLDNKTLNLIKDNQNILVALGPDIAITNNNNRFNSIYKIDDDLTFLKILKDIVSSNKITFDIDYPYNITNNKIVLNDVERVESVFDSLSSKKIFEDNIINFNKRLEKKI